MKIEVDVNKIPADIYPEEYFFLSLLFNNQEYHGISEVDLEQKGYIRIIDSQTITLLPKGRELFNKEKNELEDLATYLRLIWPSGRKDGRWPWRCSVRDCADKLSKFIKKYGKIEYTEIKSAAERYLKRFNSVDGYAGMQLLKYFILKDGMSSLMDEIEGKEDAPERVKTTTTLI
jgi:hypothetical protein